jgi:hypothetical protein
MAWHAPCPDRSGMKTLIVVIVIAVAGFLGYRGLIGGQTVSWNQRLTVIVDTPAGEVRGSAVTSVTNTDTSGLIVPPEARGVRNEVVGEAVAVEVTPGRWLFALLDGREDGKGDAAHLAYSAFRLNEAEVDGRASYEASMAKLKAQPLDTPGTIPPSDYPLMVTFEDITKPETVRRVDPADLAASFGPGVTLKAVTLEVTEAEVTGGRVEGILGWWLKMRSENNNALPPLRLPNSSPRGWDNLDPLQFWSLDKLLQLNGRVK